MYKRKPRRRSTSSSSSLSSPERPPPKIRRHSESAKKADTKRREKKEDVNELNMEDDNERTKQAEVKKKVAELKSRASGTRIPNPQQAGSSTDKPREAGAGDASSSYSYEEEVAAATPRADDET